MGQGFLMLQLELGDQSLILPNIVIQCKFVFRRSWRPVGSILSGSEEFIKAARKWRKRLGGGLRQSGIIAAPGLIALTKMKDRLILDHKNARLLAEGIQNIYGLQVANQIDTNIIIVDVSGKNMNSNQFVERLKGQGVLAGTFGNYFVRFVTHFDVSKEEIEKALASIEKAIR